VIEPTDEMLDEMLDLYETVRRAYWTAHDHEAAGMTVAEHHRAAARPALKAVLALVERDYVIRPRRRKPAQIDRSAPGCMCAPTGKRYRLCPVHGIYAAGGQ
jgi:hypothetical protein